MNPHSVLLKVSRLAPVLGYSSARQLLADNHHGRLPVTLPIHYVGAAGHAMTTRSAAQALLAAFDPAAAARPLP